MPQKAPPMAPAPTRPLAVLHVRLAVGVAHDLGRITQLDDHVLLQLREFEAEAVGLHLVLEAEDHHLTHRLLLFALASRSGPEYGAVTPDRPLPCWSGRILLGASGEPTGHPGEQMVAHATTCRGAPDGATAGASSLLHAPSASSPSGASRTSACATSRIEAGVTQPLIYYHWFSKESCWPRSEHTQSARPARLVRSDDAPRRPSAIARDYLHRERRPTCSPSPGLSWTACPLSDWPGAFPASRLHPARRGPKQTRRGSTPSSRGACRRA